MKATLVAGLAVLLMAGMANASATVTLTGSQDGTNWYVWAKVTGDNDGLSFLDLKISGINEVGVWDAISETYKAANVDATIQDDYKNNALMNSYGFNQEKGNATSIGVHAIEMVFGMNPAYEGTSNAKYNLRHLGQQSVTFSYKGYPGTSSTPTSWMTTPFDPMLGMLVADGVMLPGVLPGFTGTAIGANLWGAGTSTASAADIIVESVDPSRRWGGIPAPPEPATLSLLGAGALMTLIRRRRR
jgi:hypothetical protein